MKMSESKPSISIRKYIKWGDAAPSEPTSTRVITSPRRRFVDVRLLLPLPADREPVRDAARVDWAFAGTSKHDDTVEPPHSVFEHWIDSRHIDAETVRDEGDMYPGASADEDVERGCMVNPDTATEEAYEECWVGGLDHRDRSGHVLKYEGDRGRGLIVRIGELVQGVLRIDGEIAIVRYEVGDGRSTKSIAEIGNVGAFPDLGVQKVQTGNICVPADGLSWVCVEDW